MAPTRYPWDVGTRLTAEVQVRDVTAAQAGALELLDYVCDTGSAGHFDEARLRVVQTLTIVSRAAYTAGANPDQLLDVNLRFINDILAAKSKRRLAAIIKRSIRDCVTLVPERDMVRTRRLKDAMDYIREHCTEDIRRQDVARHIGCSRSYLSTMFSRATGHTFKEILLKYRMDRAKDLLQDGDRAITQIAFDVGYSEPNYFSEVFKRVVGVTPSQFRRRVRQSPALS